MRTRLFLAAAFAITTVNAYLHTCRLPNVVKILYYDASMDAYVPLEQKTNTVNEKNNNTRLLSHQDDQSLRRVLHRAMDERRLNDEPRLSARYCDCFSEFGVEPFYCPAHVEYCGATPGSSGADVGCYNTSPHREIASNALFVASACLCAVFAWLLLSEPGKHARNSLVGLLVPKWNDRLVSHLLRQYPERALHMMRLHLRHVHQTMGSQQQQQQQQHDQEWLLDANAVRRLMLDLDSPWSVNKPDDGRRPVALKLKTCIYESKENGPSILAGGDDENSDDCAICYQDLMNGERIGVLVCGHKLHAACLKEWCCRRNTCPLCNCNEIAEPQFQNDPQAIAADLRRNLRI